MGTACGTLNCKGKKYQKQPKATIIKRPTKKDLSFEEDQKEPDIRLVKLPEAEEARIGVFFQVDELIKALTPSLQRNATKQSRMDKWFKMITYGLDEDLINKAIIKRNKTPLDTIEFSKYAKIGLSNFYETYPDLFLSRLSKGPPPQYRWLAWREVTFRRLKPVKGLYEELLTKGKNSIWMHDIMKDLDRTFPTHPFFDKERYGNIGQKALMNILQSFSIYNDKVGYCQSMNFLVGFIMLVNGGNEKEAFWFFTSLTKTSKPKQDSPKIEGIRGFYKKEFPLLQQYFYIFDQIFQNELPVLHQHFSEISIPNLLWLQKWFQSLFLYSFPLGLCIRIWDNILVYGTRYIFQVSIAILRLIQEDLLQLDIQGVNDYFKSFKDEEQPHLKLLPPIETIINESFKIRLNPDWIDELKEQYKSLQSPKKNKESGKIGLAIIRQQALENFEKQHQEEMFEQVQQEQQFQQLNNTRPAYEEEKIMMEDIENQSIDNQEDQQAQSSMHPAGGSSSGGMIVDVSGSAKIEKKFNPQIVNYEDQSRKSMKSRVHSTRNLGQRTDNISIHQSMNQAINDDIKLPPIHQNRNYMIFGSTMNRDQFNMSLTNKNSSENFSITQSMHEAESEKIKRDLIRASSSSAQLHQLNLSNSGSNLPVQVQQRQIINYKEKVKNPKVAQKNYNIYQQAHHHLLQRLRDQKQQQNSTDRVREESLEDIQDVDDDQDEIGYPNREDTSQNNKIDDSQDLIMIERFAGTHPAIKRPAEQQFVDTVSNTQRKAQTQSINNDINNISQSRTERKQSIKSASQVIADKNERAQQDEENKNSSHHLDTHHLDDQMGDQVSQNSMIRGQESDCLTESNKLNIEALLKQRQELEKIRNQGGINSDTIIHFVNNLPI